MELDRGTLMKLGKPERRPKSKTQASSSVEVMKGPWWDRYREHLQSPHWAGIRTRRLALDDEQCAGCGATESLQVHHLTYERMGAELLSDLVTLCASCHDQVTVISRMMGFKNQRRATQLFFLMDGKGGPWGA